MGGAALLHLSEAARILGHELDKRGMFLSSFESNVDGKRRVSIPATYRKVLGGEEGVFLWPSLDKPCLEGGGSVVVAKFQRSIARLKPLDPRREALSYAIFGRGKTAKFDDGGRVVLEPELIEAASLNGKAKFIGLGDRFQIWAPELHVPRATKLQDLALEAADLLDPFDQDEEAMLPL